MPPAFPRLLSCFGCPCMSPGWRHPLHFEPLPRVLNVPTALVLLPAQVPACKAHVRKIKLFLAMCENGFKLANRTEKKHEIRTRSRTP